MKILQLNDTHEGITKPATLRKLFKKAAQEDFDVLLHCGDYCGGSIGNKTLNSTVRLIREYIPEKPFVSVIGNHDNWVQGTALPSRNELGTKNYGYPSLSEWQENYRKILASFQQYNVHFIDNDGPFRWEGVTIIGHSGWYSDPFPHTHVNDFDFMPLGLEGDTHRFMQITALRGFEKNLNMLTDKDAEGIIVFVSHFPVIKTKAIDGKDNWDTGFDIFGGDTSIGDIMQSRYGCRYFFNGHAHQLHKGPLRYETGTDYHKPQFQVVHVK